MLGPSNFILLEPSGLTDTVSLGPGQAPFAGMGLIVKASEMAMNARRVKWFLKKVYSLRVIWFCPLFVYFFVLPF
jgi:hypothetical protein